MRENGKQTETISASLGDEVAKALINKVVENGTAIEALKEQIHRLPDPSPPLEAMDQRMAKLQTSSETIGAGISDLLTRTQDNGTTRTAMESLQKELEKHVNLFTKPTRKEVHHTHFLGKPFWALLIMLMIAGAEFVALTTSWNKATQYEKNDIKWRAAMLSEDSAVIKELNKTERNYNDGPDQFRKDVVEEEERRAELYRTWLREQENLQKIQELQNAKKMK